MCDVRLASFDDLVIELCNLTSQRFEHAATGGGNAERLSRPGMPCVVVASKPAAALHAREYRIQRARAQAMSMAGKLLDHPEPVDRVPRRVVQNVKFPEGKTELAVNRSGHVGDTSDSGAETIGATWEREGPYDLREAMRIKIHLFISFTKPVNDSRFLVNCYSQISANDRRSSRLRQPSLLARVAIGMPHVGR